MKHSAIIILGLFIIITGCASPQTRYYHLSPAKGDCPGCDSKAIRQAIISIGPVSIPDRLDRSQIVTLQANNEIHIAQFDRWAGSINDEIIRTMARNISDLLPAMNVVPFDMEKWVNPDYRVRVDIIQLDVVPGKMVSFSAYFSITGKDRTTLVLKSVSSTESTGSGYSEMVDAQSRVIGALSSQIAQSLTAVLSKQ
jgi:uncharacterized lipoprotein YmbA